LLHIAKAAQPDQPVAGWARDVRKIKAEIVVIDTIPSEREMGASAALADIILAPALLQDWMSKRPSERLASSRRSASAVMSR
jgi:hypothetical protein